MKRLCLPAIVAAMVSLSVSPVSAGMQAGKMLRDVAVNHDLEKIKRSILSDVRSDFLNSKQSRQEARISEPVK